MSAEQRYREIFRPANPQWPEWADLSDKEREVFVSLCAPNGSAAGRGKLEEGVYPGARAISWVEDTVGGQPILRVRLSIPLAEGKAAQCDWTGWLQDLWDSKDTEKPGVTLRGLRALGMTAEDVRAWLSAGQIRGLDRHDVEVVVAPDKGGYLQVKYINSGPRDLVAKAPPSAQQMAAVKAQMLAALTKVEARKVRVAACPKCGKARDGGGGPICTCPPL